MSQMRCGAQGPEATLVRELRGKARAEGVLTPHILNGGEQLHHREVACTRSNEIAIDYANRRQAFGAPLIDHEGVGFMLAENQIDLQQAELMIYWCAAILDGGALGTVESAMTKVSVSQALMRIAGKCFQVMGGTGVSGDTIVQQVLREVRAFRIYDGPTEVHKWSLAKKINLDWKVAQ